MKKLAYGLLTGGIFLDLFFEYFHTITAFTQDLGRHLLTGKIILQTRHIPKENLFSYTYPHFPFINHHWLSEVIFYLMFHLGGANSLLIFTVVIVLLSFTIVFFYALKRTNFLTVASTSLLMIPMFFERTDIRPEIFSFLFLSLFMVILYGYKQNQTKWIVILPFIELLWVNMHIYFLIGICVVGIFLIDAFVGKRKEIVLWVQRKSRFPKNLVFLIIVFGGCVLATVINPNGLQGALFPFTVFQNYGYSIEENQNIFFLQQYYHFSRASIIYFEISVILLFITLFVSINKTYVYEWLLAIFFTVLAASAVRNFPLFVFGAFIPFSYRLEVFTNKLLFTQTVKKTLSVLVFLIILWQIGSSVQKNTVGFGVTSGAANAMDFFIVNHVQGPIFNNFDIGSYIEYRLYPKEKVFVDGRPEVYPKEFFQQLYIPMQQDSRVFQTVDNQYRLNTIIFSYTDQTPWGMKFLTWITRDEKWKIIYLDDYIIILVKNTDNNQPFIKQFGMDESRVVISNLQRNNLQSLIHLAYLFNAIGWSKQEEKIYHDMLQIDPNNCLALYNITVLYQRENNPAKTIYLEKAQALCP